MSNEIHPPIAYSNEIGIAVVLMEDIGPQTHLNFSDLDEISAMYLAVKGFTAFLTGFERTDFGPGKIRGILQIPESTFYAVAIDLNMRGTGFEEDPRLQTSRVGVVCLIANDEQLDSIRRFYHETEAFLIDRLKIVNTVNHLNESFCLKIKEEYNVFLKTLTGKTEKKAEVETHSLFEISVLLSLPKDENLTARVIMDAMSTNVQGLSLDEISKITKRKKKAEQIIIDILLVKGLIIANPSSKEKNGMRYLAK
ncbi:MAG: hypothetical protein KAS22_13005 [Candidatus Heimdallarchaeota archaeon]|nr:hypothetical protein [Candidatus Heimdallarchaeota archaeon]MCK5159573.1 hypothetical protein [Candidatus Heimdallarchaeota archaeon]